MELLILKQGARGPAVGRLQRAMNKRRADRGLPSIEVDEVLGPITWAAWEETYEALGGKPGTFAGGRVRALRRYQFVRFPGTRGALARSRAKKWKAKQPTGPAAASAFYRRYNGKKESPAGSNLGSWGLTEMQRELGSWLVGQAWCGTILGHALMAAGVQGINSRVASVRLILDDALNGRNGFERTVFRRSTGLGSVSAIRIGDAVGLYGEGTHVELVDEITKNGVWCWGGNTSPAGNGSVSNGGQVCRNFRPWASVVYAARPRYPKD